MKTVKILLLGFCMLVFNSCSDDFLSMSPQADANAEVFYKTASDFEVATIAIYSEFRNYYGNPHYLTYTEYRSDNLTYSTYIYKNVAENTLLSNDTASLWNTLYQIIYRANVVINRIDGTDIDESIKSKLKGEALAFRGMAYHHLAVFFGGVPLFTTEPTTKEALETSRSSLEETYARAEEDLNTAVSLLPPSNEQGRIDKFIAEGLLARVNITLEKWSEAVTVLDDVRTNSSYDFAQDFESIWSLEGEKSPEIMLAAVWSPELPTSWLPQQFLNVNNYTQQNFDYEDGYYESFETGDIRRDATLGYNPDDNNTPLNNKFDYGELPGDRWTMDIPALRYTDVLLMYAEALSESAGSVQTESLNIINQVRDRAGLDDLTPAQVPDMATFRDILMQERRSEFAWEGLRWFDLKRTGRAVEALQAVGHSADDVWLLYPIPQSEIDKMPDALTQNPGY